MLSFALMTVLSVALTVNWYFATELWPILRVLLVAFGLAMTFYSGWMTLVVWRRSDGDS